ncbi:MAG: molybdenum cofactor biosynthesis protein MoaE [Limisphaerales bacterium]
MEIAIAIAEHPIEGSPGLPGAFTNQAGAVVEFTGRVRGEEDGEAIAALEYEAYSPMAGNRMREILEALGETHPCLYVSVVHRVGVVAVGEAAIRVVAAARHRSEAFAMVTLFMDRLKEDVPIWKSRALPAAEGEPARTP